MHARERLETAAPVSDDATLLKLEEEVGKYMREAKRSDVSQPGESLSTVEDAVARNYFQHLLRKQARVMLVRRRTRK